MAKQSPAKIKKLRGEAMRAAAARKAARAVSASTHNDVDLDAYAFAKFSTGLRTR